MQDLKNRSHSRKDWHHFLIGMQTISLLKSRKLMKVLNVNNTIDPVTGGGTAERTFQMSRYLIKSGISCSILTTNIGLTSERIQALNGVEIIAYPCISTRFYVPKFSYKEIKQLIASVDIIHLMGHWTFLNALVYVIARRLKKPYVLCPAGSLVIYGRSKVLKRFYNCKSRV